MVSRPKPPLLRHPICARSMKELKSFGSFREVRGLIQERLGEQLRIRARGWKDLLRLLFDLRSGLQLDGEFYVSREAEVIHALLHLNGELKERALGLSLRHFSNVKLAREWRDEMALLVHPDRCHRPDAAKAMAAVQRIYNRMIRRPNK
ncbi:MAG: hypothetical protein AAGA48_33640 [Myxococcota bacterium]